MIAVKEWLQTPIVVGYVELDEFVIMPNHFHGIIVLTDNVGATRRVAQAQKRTTAVRPQKGRFTESPLQNRLPVHYQVQ